MDCRWKGLEVFVCRRVRNLAVLIRNALVVSKYFILHATDCGLPDMFSSTTDTQIDEIGVGLPPILDRGCILSQLKINQVNWWYLVNAATCESVRAMIHGAESPGKTWRCLNEHFLLLSDSQFSVWERKEFTHLKMEQGEDPHIFLSQLRDILGVVLLLEEHKNDRTVCCNISKDLLLNTVVSVIT